MNVIYGTFDEDDNFTPHQLELNNDLQEINKERLALELELVRVQEALRINHHYGTPMTSRLMQELWLEEGRIKNELDLTRRKREIKMAKKQTVKTANSPLAMAEGQALENALVNELMNEETKTEKVVTSQLVDLHTMKHILFWDFKSKIKKNFRIQNDSSFLEGKTILQVDRGQQRKAETGSRWESVGVINQANGRTYLNLFARHREEKFLSELSAMWNIGKIQLEKLPMPEKV